MKQCGLHAQARQQLLCNSPTPWLLCRLPSRGDPDGTRQPTRRCQTQCRLQLHGAKQVAQQCKHTSRRNCLNTGRGYCRLTADMKNAVTARLAMMLSHHVKHVWGDVVHGMTHSWNTVGLTRRQAAAGIHCSSMSSKSSELRRLAR
jgi:hypothetical protein